MVSYVYVLHYNLQSNDLYIDFFHVLQMRKTWIYTIISIFLLTTFINLTNATEVECLELIKGHNSLAEKRINIVLVGFNYSSLDSFLSIANKVIEGNHGLFSFEPFKSDKCRFNIWYVNQIGAAKDMQMNRNGVILGKQSYELADVCTKKLGYFREETTPANLYFSDRMFTFFIINKPRGGSAYSTLQAGNREFLRNEPFNQYYFGLKGALVHITEEGKPFISPRTGTRIDFGTDGWESHFYEQVLSFSHEFGHAFTTPYGYEEYNPHNYKYLIDEYTSISQSKIFEGDKEHSNCFIGTINECMSEKNKVFGDLIGNGCGKDGVIDCCTNNPFKISSGARACTSCPECHEDPDYDLEISCYEGCRYKTGSFRGTFNSLMRKHASEPKSFGLVNERILLEQMNFLLPLEDKRECISKLRVPKFEPITLPKFEPATNVIQNPDPERNNPDPERNIKDNNLQHPEKDSETSRERNRDIFKHLQAKSNYGN